MVRFAWRLGAQRKLSPNELGALAEQLSAQPCAAIPVYAAVFDRAATHRIPTPSNPNPPAKAMRTTIKPILLPGFLITGLLFIFHLFSIFCEGA